MDPSRGWRQRARCSSDWTVSGSRTASAKGDHWFPWRTSEAVHPSMNFDGKVRLAAYITNIGRARERVRWEMGSQACTLIGTTIGGGLITLGGVVTTLGGDELLGCRVVNLGRFCWVAVGSGRAQRMIVGGGEGVGGCRVFVGIQLLKISRSFEMAVSCLWWMVSGVSLTAHDRKFRAWTMWLPLVTVG